MEKVQPPPSFLTESGVHKLTRTTKSWLSGLWRKLRLPTRAVRHKPSDEEKRGEKPDVQGVLHKAMLGGLVLMVGTICPWTRPLFGLPQDAQPDTRGLINTVDRIDRQVNDLKGNMGDLKIKVDKMDARITDLADAFIKGAHRPL